jgi:ABC-type amino acid transport substrate-binding protein
MKLCLVATALIACVALAGPAGAAAKKHKKAAHRVGVAHTRIAPAAAADPYTVRVGGEYIGRDPDPNIRARMLRNPHDWDGPE